MKLLSLLVFIFLSLNLSNESELSNAFIDYIYDYLPYIIKGISSSNATQCSAVLVNKKSDVLPLLKDVVSDLENGLNIIEMGLKYAARVLLIGGLRKNCKLFDLGILLDNIDSEDKIKDIGQAMQNNYENLYNLERNIKNAKDLNEMLYYFGKIIYNIINFEFN